MAEPDKSLPLSGVRIVSFAQLLQGPSGVQMLADLGAEVIKVERPGVGAWERHWSGADTYLNGVSTFFLLFNRNQRGLSVNLKSEQGIEIISRLIESADVLVENYRPGVMQRLGLGYEQLESRNPGLIYCSCSGYGSDGPYKDRPGQDMLAQAVSGLATLAGKADDPPIPAGTALVDQHGAVLLAMSVLVALLDRYKSGKGQKVELNLLNAALDLQIEPLGYLLNGGRVTQRSNSGIADPFHEPPYGVYKTKDGYLCLVLTSLDKLAAVTGNDELRRWSDGQRFDHRDEINEAIARTLLRRTTAEWLDVFTPADVWAAKVQSYDTLLDDPQVKHNDVVGQLEHPEAGTVRFLKHPVRYSRTRPSVRRPPPEVGQHTDEILGELGFTPGQIEALRRDGVV